MAESRGRDGGGQELNVESAFIGVGCNKVVGAAAWGPCNLVAYAAHHSIAIFDPQVCLHLWFLSFALSYTLFSAIE